MSKDETIFRFLVFASLIAMRSREDPSSARSTVNFYALTQESPVGRAFETTMMSCCGIYHAEIARRSRACINRKSQCICDENVRDCASRTFIVTN